MILIWFFEFHVVIFLSVAVRPTVVAGGRVRFRVAVGRGPAVDGVLAARPPVGVGLGVGRRGVVRAAALGARAGADGGGVQRRGPAVVHG